MSDQNQFLLYTAPNGAVKVDVVLKDETVWLTQKALAELFGVRVPGINKHLKNIFGSGELVEDSVISILETTATDGKNYQTRYYNLDAIIAVGSGRICQRDSDIKGIRGEVNLTADCADIADESQ